MARIRKKTLCSTISLRRTLRSPKSRVTRLGERDCNGERDRMDAGTLMDCDWVTGAPVQYDSTSPGYPGVEAHCDRTSLAGRDETRVVVQLQLAFGAGLVDFGSRASNSAMISST